MPTQEHTPDLREYLRILRARKYQIALVTLLLLGAVGYLSFKQTPIYEGDAEVFVQPAPDTTSTAAAARPPNLDTERQLVLSLSVASMVQDTLKLSISPDELLKHVKVEVVPSTEVLDVKYTDPNPQVAADRANAFAQAYVDFRTQGVAAQFTAALDTVQKQLGKDQAKAAHLDAQIAKAPNPQTASSLEATKNSILVQIGVLNAKELDLQQGAAAATNIAQVVQSAEVTTSPVAPKKVRNILAALVGGLALGIGIALLREHLDDRIKSRQELESVLSAPVMAIVPRAKGRPGGKGRLFINTDHGVVSEGYRRLGTAIQYLGAQQGVKTLMITSAVAGEGKSTTVANLGVALAETGRKVIIVSADLRRPSLHTLFGLENTRGMSDVLSGSGRAVDVTLRTGVDNLKLVNGGPVPENPAEVLGGDHAKQFLSDLRAKADFVLLDTPPVLAVADASTLMSLVDGVVYVVDPARAGRFAAVEALDQIAQAGGRLVGAVYNNVKASTSGSYYYYRYYSSDGQRVRSRDGRRPGTPVDLDPSFTPQTQKADRP